MIAYRFQSVHAHPKFGVVTAAKEEPRPAMFMTPEDAKQKMLNPAMRANDRLTIAKIQVRVAEHYGFTPEQMRSKSRNRRYAHPRQMAMLLAREFTKSSLPDIGNRFGWRDHTTVIHGIRAARKRIETDPGEEFNYETLRQSLRA